MEGGPLPCLGPPFPNEFYMMCWLDSSSHQTPRPAQLDWTIEKVFSERGRGPCSLGRGTQSWRSGGSRKHLEGNKESLDANKTALAASLPKRLKA